MRGRMPEMMMPWAIDQSIPAIAYPIRHHTSSDGPVNRADVTWLIIQLNPSVLQKEIFPELTQKFFGSASGMDYYVAVKAVGNDGERVVYSSAAGSDEEKNRPPDAALNLIGPPFGRGGPPERAWNSFLGRDARAIMRSKAMSSTWQRWNGCQDSIHFITPKAETCGRSRRRTKADQWKQP